MRNTLTPTSLLTIKHYQLVLSKKYNLLQTQQVKRKANLSFVQKRRKI